MPDRSHDLNGAVCHRRRRLIRIMTAAPINRTPLNNNGMSLMTGSPAR
jgi:hypothetical protein